MNPMYSLPTTPAEFERVLVASARALYPESVSQYGQAPFQLFAELRGEMNGNRQAVRPFLEPRIMQHVERWRRGDQPANAAFIARVHAYRTISNVSTLYREAFQEHFGYSFNDYLFEDLWEEQHRLLNQIPTDCADLRASLSDLHEMLAAGTMFILQYREWGQSSLMMEELRSQEEGDYMPYATLAVQVATGILQPRPVA